MFLCKKQKILVVFYFFKIEYHLNKSLRARIRTMNSTLQESETGILNTKPSSNGLCLDFFWAKQVLLGSYFQMANMLMLQRVNGLTGEESFVKDQSNQHLLEDFISGYSSDKVFGDKR